MHSYFSDQSAMEFCMSGNRKKEVDAAVADVDFDKNKYQIKFETSMGDITLDLWPDVAPGHCKNIIGLAKIGFYDGLIFHRVIDGFVIQGGCPSRNGTGGPGYNVNGEFNSKPHDKGVLSMARAQDPNSAGSQFFLCLARVPYLDNQYTGFGVTADQASLDVVLKIGSVKTGSGDKPVNDVTINKGSVIVSPK
jgi:peptidyl-prolyl cis-trans isomerase B (cyclophilin B)